VVALSALEKVRGTPDALRVGFLKVAGIAEALEWALLQLSAEAEVAAPNLVERLTRWRLFTVRVQGACLEADAAEASDASTGVAQ
jgi:hypothetical protein